MKHEIAEIQSEVKEKTRLSLFALADDPHVGVWVDSNVMMYAPTTDKRRLLEFSQLRTVPEVGLEVGKRARKTSYLWDSFLDAGGVQVGLSSFKDLNLDQHFQCVFQHAACYSPLTQVAIAENLRRNGSTSPIENGALLAQTNQSSFLESADSTLPLSSLLGLSASQKDECDKLRRAWFKYHREREQRLYEKTYLWTDETLVASAITDGIAHRCVSMILTTDWDAFVIIKQFADNVVYHAASLECSTANRVEVFDGLFNERCHFIDSYNSQKRFRQAAAIFDGNLFETCEPADLFIWHYPTDSYVSYAFPPDFISWLNVLFDNSLNRD